MASQIDKMIKHLESEKQRITKNAFEAAENARTERSPEEIYDLLKKGADDSEYGRDFTSSEGRATFTRPQSVSTYDNPLDLILKEHKIDDDGRRVRVHFRPDTKGYNIEATRLTPDQGWQSSQSPSRIKEENIASLTLDDKGKVAMMKSSYAGAKEKALERLFAEAGELGLSPQSTNQLPQGQRAVKRMAERLEDKEQWLEKLKNLKTTGKLNKLWSAIPLLGAGATAYSALNSPSAEAATEEVLSEFDPFGIALPDKVNVGDDAPHGGVPEDEIRRRYLEHLKTRE